MLRPTSGQVRVLYVLSCLMEAFLALPTVINASRLGLLRFVLIILAR